jgi:hypothetical protein
MEKGTKSRHYEWNGRYLTSFGMKKGNKITSLRAFRRSNPKGFCVANFFIDSFTTFVMTRNIITNQMKLKVGANNHLPYFNKSANS